MILSSIIPRHLLVHSVAPEPHSIPRAHFWAQHTRGRSAGGQDLITLCSGMSWPLYLLLHQTFGIPCSGTGGPQDEIDTLTLRELPDLGSERRQEGYGGRCYDGEEHGCGHTEPSFVPGPILGREIYHLPGAHISLCGMMR